jgi:hypothetical protein
VASVKIGDKVYRRSPYNANGLTSTRTPRRIAAFKKTWAPTT